MCEPLSVAALMADIDSAFVSAYWLALIVGGGLLVLSLVAGHGHHDVDADAGSGIDLHGHGDIDAGPVDVASDLHVAAAHADVGHPDAGHAEVSHAHGGASQISTWLSVRFAIFFLAVFGAIGVILTYVSPTGPRLTLGLALAGGALVGQGVHHLFRLIRRTSGNTTPQTWDYVNQRARVTIGVKPPDPGEVVVHVRGSEHYVPAVSKRPFAAGEEVVVVGYRAGVAEVASKSDFEQRRKS